MVRRLILLTIFILSISTCGFAQTHQDPSVPAETGGWVVVAYIGGAHTTPSDLKILQPSFSNDLDFENVRFESRSFHPPLYYGFRAGYFLSTMPCFGIEAEFIHLKVFSNPQQRVRVAGLHRGTTISGELPLGEIVQQYSISHGVNLLLFNAALRHALSRRNDGPFSRIVLSARAGVGPTLPHTESTIEGQRQEQYEVGSVGWQVAGNSQVRLWKGLSAFGEYKFTRTRQSGKVFAGTAHSLLRTHHGVLGLSYDF